MDNTPLITEKKLPTVRLFLCGDVMTGRGVDQILPHPSNPRLFESYVRDANEYVRLAERKSGPLPKRPVDFSYPWGDALTVLAELRPDASIINLETAVTQSDDNWPDKGIHYRMHPDNVPLLTSANIDCCVLANNHVLDWGHEGLEETLRTLRAKGIHTAGAGHELSEAEAPASVEIGRDRQRRRVLVYAWADESSGVPTSWAAKATQDGVNFLKEGVSTRGANQIGECVKQNGRQRGDVVVVSLHWGDNWGYPIPRAEREFAHRLVDEAGVDIVYGHSSHHAKALEVHNGKLILYGCGDFLNDYEGISGYEEYRDDLTLMYFPSVNPENGALVQLIAVPMQIRNMRLNKARIEDAKWLHSTMRRECGKFGVGVDLDETTNWLTFRW